MGEKRLTILANSNVSRGKFAAAAVHAALIHYGIKHGAVIVLGAGPESIERQCDSVVHDAGRTEVRRGTITAGVRKDGEEAEESEPSHSESLIVEAQRGSQGGSQGSAETA